MAAGRGELEVESGSEPGRPVDPLDLRESIDTYIESAGEVERWMRVVPFAVIAAMVLLPALALLLPVASEAAQITESMAIAVWLVGGCLVAASFPDAAGLGARRRRSATAGFLILLALGALPIALNQGGVVLLVSNLLFALGFSAFYLYMVGLAWQVFGPIGGVPEMPEELRDPEALRQELNDVLPRLKFAESVLRFTLLPAGRRRLRAHAEAMRRLPENPTNGTPAPLDFGWLRRRLVAPYEALAVTALSLTVMIKVAAIHSEFRRVNPAIASLQGRITRLRTVGPALLAFGFILAWLCVYLLVWVVEPAAWQGVGGDKVQFGDFVYLTVSGAFGGPGDSPVQPATQGMLMLMLAETITAATILTLYLRAVWEDEKLADATDPPVAP